MPSTMPGAIEGALAGQLPERTDADDMAGSAPPIPDEDTERAALTLERTCSVQFANRMRRAWHRAHADTLAGRVGHPPAGVTTVLYDAGCDLCDGKGMVADRRQAVHTTYTFCTCGEGAKRRAAQREVAQYSLLAQYTRATLLNTEDRAYQRPAVAALLSFLEDYDGGDPSWLTLLGDTSGGKTWLAAVIGNCLLERGAQVLMQSTPDLLDHLRAAFNPNVGGQYDALFEKVRGVEVLILDDLGTEKPTDWAAEKLYQILQDRTVHNRATVVTTNEPLNNLGNRIAGRLAFRERRRLCVVETGRAGKPLKGFYMFQHDEVVCQKCGCRPCWEECKAQTYPAGARTPEQAQGVGL